MAAFRLVTTLAFAVVLASSCQANPTQGLFAHERVVSPDECSGITTTNDFCSRDCTSMINCRTGSPMEVKDCTATGLFCFKSESIFACNRINKCGGPIWCTQAGIYPDPDKCTIYHTCSGASVMSTVSACADDLAFDLTTHECGLPLDDVTCTGEGPVPTCTMPQQRGTLPANPAHYYNCMMLDSVLYPGQYQCAEDEMYSETLSQCVPLVTTPTEATTTSTTTPTTTTPTTTPTTTSTTTPTPTPTTTDSSGTTTSTATSATTASTASTASTATTDNTGTTEQPPAVEDAILSIVLGGIFTAIVIAACVAGGVVYLKKRKLKAAVPRQLGPRDSDKSRR